MLKRLLGAFAVLILLAGCASPSASPPATAATPAESAAILAATQEPLPEVGQRTPAGEFRWTRVGGDPCNPRAGCTIEFALNRSGWPQEVQQAFLRLVREQRGREVTIASGWRGWMTWGSRRARFHPRTVAAWPSGQREVSDEWSYVLGDTEYVLIRVHKCRNWGGYTRPLTQRVEAPRPALPIVACP